MSQTTILTVEDDAAIRRGIVDALEFAGFHVLQAARGDEGSALLTVSALLLAVAALLLGETVRVFRFSAVGLGMVGVLIVLFALAFTIAEFLAYLERRVAYYAAKR